MNEQKQEKKLVIEHLCDRLASPTSAEKNNILLF